MRRAKRPLNKMAVTKANAAIYNLTHPPGRRLDPSSAADAELCKKWLAAYESAGGAIEDVSPGGAVGKASASCPNWIELRYLHCNAAPVKSAQYHIRSPIYSTDGVLGQDGSVYIVGVPDISSFRYWFDYDPEKYKPLGPAIQTSTGTARKEAVSALDGIGDWIWGLIQGDFNKDQSVSQLAVNTLLGLIPIVDQVLDVRDLISGVKDIIEFYCEEESQQQAHEDVLGLSYETWLWISLFIIAIGCIPEVGSAVKGVLKGLIRFLQDATKKAANLSPAQLRRIWEELLKILNHFGINQGNAHQWLKQMPGKLSGWMDEAAVKIKAALDSVRVMMEKTEEYARRFGGKKLPFVGEILSAEQAQQIIARVRKYKDAIAKAYNRLDQMKRRVQFAGRRH